MDTLGTSLTIVYEDMASTSFHAIWLRDHCRCQMCYHPGTKQRLLDSSKIDTNITIKRASLSSKGENDELTVVYGGVGGDDGHVSSFSIEWLRYNSYYPHIRQPTQKR